MRASDSCSTPTSIKSDCGNAQQGGTMNLIGPLKGGTIEMPAKNQLDFDPI
jgi:hypothetical protein